MKTLSDARAELARLQRRELELVQELLNVRKAVAAQKVVINELIEIFLLIGDRQKREWEVGCYWNHDRRHRWEEDRLALATVSRRWRALILGIPGVWSEVCLGYYLRPTLLKLRLERSRQAPLTISLGCKYGPPRLEVVLPHANRFHTLRICATDDAKAFLGKIAGIRLPSLRYLVISADWSADDLLTIRSWAPSLKHLELRRWKVPSHMALSQFIAAESLEELSLVDVTTSDYGEFHSMHFPLLRRLALDIPLPMSFLDAIVAPKLTSFYFTGQYCATPPYGTSIGDVSKFNNVSHLSFVASPYEKTVSKNALDMSERLCRIFHGIRYATIHVDYVSALFSPSNPWQSNQCLIDHCWKFLESLEIRDFTLSSIELLECLMAWLTWRENSGQPKLHLKLLHKPHANGLVTLDTSHTLYQTLRECCASLELDRVPVSF
ncbi:hypothetical protein M404DRAFT_323073 [Pisolithus tinctorius Marx 270]|uniref:F-box domain-containing protein n=1 Tax=Pisolithus tinctorius Marx 270 TaxID=870435 RepID=A0A0C3P622_PISTI|nr:hypothetical protein M404DRAFT_323073 [Pisolithus tinctorius Marx 270]